MMRRSSRAAAAVHDTWCTCGVKRKRRHACVARTRVQSAARAQTADGGANIKRGRKRRTWAQTQARIL
eukprot:326160-Chlamydomonas_euryale.AAC.7